MERVGKAGDTRHPWTRVALAALWLLIVGLFVLGRVTTHPAVSGGSQIGALLYVAVLVPWLVVSPPRAVDLHKPARAHGRRIGFLPTVVLVLVGLVAILALGILLNPWLVLVAVLTICALWIIITRRHRLSIGLIALGVAVGVFPMVLEYLSGRLDPLHAIYLTCVSVLFVGGVIVVREIGFGQVHIAEYRWRPAVRGFLSGCVLALPVALLNAGGGGASRDLWVDRAWEPLVAFVPGIAEETWARLFMMTLLYAVFRTASAKHPRRAVAAALLISAAAHGLVHLPGEAIFSSAAFPALLNGLVFGVPMGLLFAKRDFEHAVGYHFFIDFLRFAAAFVTS